MQFAFNFFGKTWLVSTKQWKRQSTRFVLKGVVAQMPKTRKALDQQTLSLKETQSQIFGIAHVQHLRERGQRLGGGGSKRRPVASGTLQPLYRDKRWHYFLRRRDWPLCQTAAAKFSGFSDPVSSFCGQPGRLPTHHEEMLRSLLVSYERERM